MKIEQNDNSDVNVWSLYLYALKSPVSREKYQARLEKFFDFLGLGGIDLEEKSKSLITSAKNNGNQWVFNNVLKYMQFHLDRVNRKEIAGSTVRNYLKSIKLFCEMADISVWGLITISL